MLCKVIFSQIMDILLNVRNGGKFMVWLLIFLLVLLLPIPIKTSVFYSEKKLGIYVYNLKLNINKIKKKPLVNKIRPHKKKYLPIIKLAVNV